MKQLLLLSLFLFPALCKSQTIRFTDLNTGFPVENVKAISEALSVSLNGNYKGEISFNRFYGAADIQIYAQGYTLLYITYNDLLLRAGDSGRIELKPTFIQLSPFQITASRWENSINNSPSTILTINPKELELINPQTAADALGASGEVYIQKSQQSGGSPMIRGFGTNRLMNVVDGVRMNTAIFRTGNIQNVIALDPFAIEKTEVLFGPGSVMYGSDAIGGVMNFSTLTPSFSTNESPTVSGKLGLRFSSANNEQTAHFHLNLGWKRIASVTSFTTYKFGDLKMGSRGPDDYLKKFVVQRTDSIDRMVTNPDPKLQDPSAYSQINFMEKLRFLVTKNLELNYGFHYSQSSDNPRYDRLTRLKSGLPVSAEWFYGPQVWMMNQVSLLYSQKTLLYSRMTLRLAYQKFEESRHDRDFNSSEKRNRTEQVHAYSINLDFEKIINPKLIVHYGSELVWDNVKSKGTNENILTSETVTGPSRYPQSDWLSGALYSEAEYILNNKNRLIGGIRYNYVQLNSDFSNNTAFYPLPFTTSTIKSSGFSGSLGWVYNATANLMIRALGSNGFRAPNVDDMGKVFDSQPGFVIVPNKNLKPEIAWNAETGISLNLGKRIHLDGVVYFTYVNQAMVRRNFTLNGLDSIVYDGKMSKVEAVQNASFSRVTGTQLSLECLLPYSLSFKGTLNLQKGNEVTDNGTKSPMLHLAPTFGTIRLAYTKKGIQLMAYSDFNGIMRYNDLSTDSKNTPYLYAKDSKGQPYSPSWYTINFKSSFRLKRNMTLQVGIENLLDKRYRPYRSGISAAGRNFVIGWRSTF